MAKYIYQHANWTDFKWSDKSIQPVFGEVKWLQGLLLGQMNNLGFGFRDEALLRTLTSDIIKSSEIEGEHLPYDQVRSSIARRLGLNVAGMVVSERNVEGVVDMLIDATHNHADSLTEERLFGWHASIFPDGYSGRYKIEVGRYRTGIMQIVSGAIGKERVHYEAVPPGEVKTEMDAFLKWFNSKTDLDHVLKAAIAHFWFIIIHPFDDGNGRIARAISDLLLTRSDRIKDRFYSLSSQILEQRKEYYSILQQVQYSTGDITEWILWFLNCLKNALLHSQEQLRLALSKVEFWNKHENTLLNARQRLVLNKMLDGWEGNMKTSKWSKIAKCSTDTALRDIQDLVARNILKQDNPGGRSTSYILSPLKPA
jgi:Fic family protein